MSEWMRGARAACDRFAPTLALLDDPASSTLDPAERVAALEHLAGCARCQADQAADAQLDAALRRAFRPQAAAPLRTRDLLLAIGATHEPAAHMTVAPARGAVSPIRSVVDLGDFEGGFERMSESDEGNGATRAEGTTSQAAPTSEAGQPEGQSAPARKMAAIPSLRPAPRHRGQRGRPSSQALAMGFSATAAAVILVVVAATLFASRGRAPATHTSAAQHASATATAQAKLAATATGPIYAISMDSPSDGWALGDATPPQPQNSNSPMQPVAALYHYDGRQWTLKQRVSGYPADTFEPSALKMLSATDGWAFGSTGNLLRYDGTTWRMETISPSGGAQVNNVLATDIVSPTEGWAVAYISPGGGGSAIGFLRFDGSQWTVEQQGIKLPSDLDPQGGLQIAGMTALPGGDVWVIGSANVKVTASVATATSNAGNNPEERGLLIHRAHGVWTVDDVVSLPANVNSSQFNDIAMTSPTSGWVVGQTTVNMQSVAGGPMLPVQQPLLLRYDGVRWVSVQAPQDIRANSDALSSVTASGPDNVWALVPTNGGDINANGERVSAIFLRYDGATWTEVQGTFPGVSTANADNILISAMALGPDGTLWGMGATLTVKHQQGIYSPLIVSYRDGAWSAATIVTK